jgi:hypothetical protein
MFFITQQAGLGPWDRKRLQWLNLLMMANASQDHQPSLMKVVVLLLVLT